MAGSTTTTVSDSVTSSSSSSRTRTLAIIKAHAIANRFEIESRISSSGFEIIKERQMAFNDDDAGVRELFAEAASSLCGEPVWIYVLERRRAVEVWKSVMGHEDPEVARTDSPDSLRALFGKSAVENAVYGSPDANMADLQIDSIFASSPPFPPQMQFHDDVDVPQESLTSGEGSGSGIRVDVKSKTKGFKARPVPPTIAVPSIQPRTTRAAALRAGVDMQAPKRLPASRESIAKTFENVPGHKRALTVNVASVAPPTIAPRANRASAIRSGQVDVSPGKGGPPKVSQARQPNSPERIKEIFADVPGHKRRQSIAVASTAPPSVAPRPTRASMLRTGGQASPAASPIRPRASLAGPPPSQKPSIKSQVSFDGVPGHKRSTTIEVASTRAPSTTPRINKSAQLRIAHKEGGTTPKAPPSAFFMRPEMTRPSSSAALRLPASSTGTNRSASVEPGGQRTGSGTSTAATPRAPSITPRTNKSALLRAKMGTSTPPAKKVFAF